MYAEVGINMGRVEILSRVLFFYSFSFILECLEQKINSIFYAQKMMIMVDAMPQPRDAQTKRGAKVGFNPKGRYIGFSLYFKVK